MSVERTTCRSCGNALLPTDAFCSGCGIPVRPQGLEAGAERRTLVRGAVPTQERRHCRSCNAPLFPGDAFCAACGSTLAAGQTPELPDSGTKLRSLIEEASQGRYRIVREIGRGGMGAVFLAQDTDLSRRVAIKVLSGGGGDPATLRRFEREARTVAQLRHEAIVRVHAVGGLGELHYFVMDYVEGISLQRLLVDQGPLPIPMVEAVLFRVAAGLAYAHGQASPVIHRDVKPSNILIDTDGQVILMDFGVAKVGDESQGLTRTGMIVGTAEYMSPEQVRSLPVTPATDQYALGAVTFAMLIGRPPFAGSFYEVLIAHQKEPVPDVREARPEVPARLAGAVARMLAKDPADRWPDLPTLLRDLQLRPLSPYDATTHELADLARSLFGTGQDDSSGETGAPGDAGSTGSLRIDLPTDQLEVGDSVSLEVALERPDGSLGAAEVTWSTDPPGVLRRDPETGEFVAVAPGTARITAHGGGVDGSVDLTVTPPQVAEVSIRPEGVTLSPGERLQLEAVALSRSGRSMEDPRTWATSDPGVVTVSDTGEVTGIREGSASVVVYCGAGWAAAAVSVEASSTEAVAEPRYGAGPAGSSGGATGITIPPPPPPPPLPPSASSGEAASRPSGERSSPGGGSASEAPSRGVIHRPSRELGTPGQGGRRPVWALGAAAVVVVAALGVWGLSGDDDGGTPPAPPSLVVTQDGAPEAGPLVLSPGEAVDLGLDPEGLGEADPSAARWTSTDPAVARTDGGRVIGVGPGDAEVTVALAGTTVRIPVRVLVPWAALELRDGDGAPLPGGTLVVDEGESASVRGVLVDESGNAVEGPDPEWVSDGPGVARYEDGAVLGVGPGSTVLSARAGGLETSLTVRVDAVSAAPTQTPAVAQPPQPRPSERAPTEARPAAPAPSGPGRLVIVVTPGWANAFLDGQPIGEYMSRYEIELGSGTYRVRLENPAFAPADTTLTVRPGETTRWERRLGNGSTP